MYAYFPSTTVSPGTRLSASAASPSGVRDISSRPIASSAAGAICRWFMSATVFPRSAVAVTSTPSIATAWGSRAMSTCVVRPATTTMSVTTFGACPQVLDLEAVCPGVQAPDEVPAPDRTQAADLQPLDNDLGTDNLCARVAVDHLPGDPPH